MSHFHGTYLVRIVTAENHTLLVRVEKCVVCAKGDGESLGLVTKIQLEDGIRGPVRADVVLGERGDLVSLPPRSA